MNSNSRCKSYSIRQLSESWESWECLWTTSERP